jgi:ANTAR domain/GAF domain
MLTRDDAADVLPAAMAHLVANFATPTDLTAILETVTTSAVQLIHEVDFADVLLVDEQRYRSMASTAALAIELDTIQQELQEGPCLAAAVQDATVVCSDLTAEPRWPQFAAAAVQAGIHSMMSFQLYTYPTKTRDGAGGRGALNLFSRNRYHFSFEDRAIGAMLATHAATALITADRQTQFESALASRDLIGQAKGIVMERFHVDAVRAFSLLTKLSQDTNTPLRTIAQRIVDTT